MADDPREAFAAIDILAVPSGPVEGAGRVIPEAFSAGVPVVAYANGGIPEFIDDLVAAKLVEIGPHAVPQEGT